MRDSALPAGRLLHHTANSRHQRHLDEDDLLHDRWNHAYDLVGALLRADLGVFQ